MIKQLAAQAAAGLWPGPEQPTAALAQALDDGPTRRFATHNKRAGISGTLSWARGGSEAGGADLAAQLANAAVVAHAPTSAVLRGS